MNTLQYAELFLTESREHVAAVNRALLALERDAAAGRTGAAAQIDEIFRAVHTIKGMAATMGYAVVAELAHELETVLERARQRTLVLDANVIDLLLQSADVLERAIEAAVAGRDGDVTAIELVAALHALGVVTSEGRDWIETLPGGPGLAVRIRLSEDTPLKGVRAFLIVQALSKVGEVVATAPPLEELQAEGFEHDFAIRLLTPRTTAEIERLIRGAGDVADVRIGEDAPRFTPTETRLPAVETMAPAVAGSAPTRHVRIDVRRLDTLMNLIGELVIVRGRLMQLAGEIEHPGLEETVLQSSRLITELREEITASRMLPMSHVFDRFPRVVRDAARAGDKQVELVIEGGDIELDRSVLDEIADSLVHLVRNAVDHGIESPADRQAQGKRATGRLVLSAARDRSAVVIKVSDDGRGIDRERVLARAKRDGIVEPTKVDLNEDELLRLIARPGFSTAERVTDLSGRGVGVDAVYTRVRALGGAMDIRSAAGQGTTMILRLPLTLAIVRAALARVAGETYAIPLAHVSETVELTPDAVRTVQGREVLLTRETVLPLLRLRALVGLPAYDGPGATEPEQVVVIDVGDRQTALAIDELTGQDEIVVKQFDAAREGLPYFGGATLLSDGTPSLILDVSSLI